VFRSISKIVERIVLKAKNRQYAAQRRIDVEELWPACKIAAAQRGEGLQEARQAFLWHALSDPCWIECYRSEEIFEFVWNLM
jgi:hypothetical protein